MSSNLVSIAKGLDSYATALEALRGLGPVPVEGRRVLLKPNIARVLPHTSGANTNPQVVAAAMDYFKENGAAECCRGGEPHHRRADERVL